MAELYSVRIFYMNNWMSLFSNSADILTAMPIIIPIECQRDRENRDLVNMRSVKV